VKVKKVRNVALLILVKQFRRQRSPTVLVFYSAFE